MKQLLFITVILFLSNTLSAIELKGKFYQGNLILGKVESKSKVFIDKKKLKFLIKVTLHLAWQKIGKMTLKLK